MFFLLEVSGPFHSDLMKPAAENFKAILDEMTIENAKIPVIANVSATEMEDATEIKTKLIRTALFSGSMGAKCSKND